MSEATFTEALRSFEAAQTREALGINPVNELSPFGPVGVGISNTLDEEASESTISAPAFPLDVLPKVLQDFILEGAMSLPVPLDLVAAPVLACLGAAIGAHRAIQLKANWTTRASLYVACIADPGSLKAPAFTLAAFPVHQQQDQYQAAYQNALVRYDEETASYQRSM